ncbi:MAG TPA: hypothetical protein VFO94_17440 [Gammaproteobacteria bacterium]|jgi:hypothetical protein|nr:hypothetical protein [Gammaproteobacteria bacterium]
MSHRSVSRAFVASVAVLAALIAASTATADVVQGTVKPATAKVSIKNAAGEQVAEVGGGPFQLRLPAGKFTAECAAPSQKKVTFFSLAQPTSVNIDCS